MPKYGKRSNEVKSQLHFILQYILDEAIIKPPHDFGLHDGHRPTDLQYEYYQQGRTTPGKIITWIDGITEINGEKVFVLHFIQGRSADWVNKPFFAILSIMVLVVEYAQE